MYKYPDRHVQYITAEHKGQIQNNKITRQDPVCAKTSRARHAEHDLHFYNPVCSRIS